MKSIHDYHGSDGAMLLDIQTASDNIKNSYASVFDTSEGKIVLSDLERIANLTKIDANDPNPSAAVWKCAQMALIQRMRNQIKENDSGVLVSQKNESSITWRLDQYEGLCNTLSRTENHMPIPEIKKLKAAHDFLINHFELVKSGQSAGRWLEMQKKWSENPFIIAAINWRD